MEGKSKIDICTRLIHFFAPILIGFGTIISVGFLLSESLRYQFWSLISAYFFPPLGKETVIPTGVGIGINPVIMALSVAFVDIVIALFLIWNYDLAKKIPIVGRFMKKVEKVGKGSSEKYAWVKPLRFIGIVLFVMVPFQGSGGMVGTVLGLVIGMNPRNTFFAISIGAILGCLLIAFLADLILSVIFENVLAGILILVAVVVIIFMIYMIYRVNKSKINK